MWSANLEAKRDEAIALMDEATYDKYQKYLTGCADFFRRGITNIGQFTLVGLNPPRSRCTLRSPRHVVACAQPGWWLRHLPAAGSTSSNQLPDNLPADVDRQPPIAAAVGDASSSKQWSRSNSGSLKFRSSQRQLSPGRQRVAQAELSASGQTGKPQHASKAPKATRSPADQHFSPLQIELSLQPQGCPEQGSTSIDPWV